MRIKAIIFSLCLILMQNLPVAAQEINTDFLWNATVVPSLKMPLWQAQTSYNAGHFLMVPLHAAFAEKNRVRMQEFADHFKELADSGYDQMDTAHYLWKIQYVYLASRFIVLCRQSGNTELEPKGLYDSIYNTVTETWTRNRIWHWWHKKAPFSTAPNMKWNIQWKLYENPFKKKTFHEAITDDELFTIAIAADLAQSRKLKGLGTDSTLQDMVQTGMKIFQKRGVFIDSTHWLFQPGYWSNYYDYRYAGHTANREGLHKKEVKEIGEDASHSLRYPLWIRSVEEAFDKGSEDQLFLEKVRKAIATQFNDKVLTKPDSTNRDYRLTNYMDGHNGLYRYNYGGRKGGTGPYGNSGTLYLGWWAFCDSSSIYNVYRDIANGLSSGNFEIPEYNIDPKANIFDGVKAGDFMKLNSILAGKLSGQ